MKAPYPAQGYVGAYESHVRMIIDQFNRGTSLTDIARMIPSHYDYSSSWTPPHISASMVRYILRREGWLPPKVPRETITTTGWQHWTPEKQSREIEYEYSL